MVPISDVEQALSNSDTGKCLVFETGCRHDWLKIGHKVFYVKVQGTLDFVVRHDLKLLGIKAARAIQKCPIFCPDSYNELTTKLGFETGFRHDWLKIRHFNIFYINVRGTLDYEVQYHLKLTRNKAAGAIQNCPFFP